MNKGTNARAKTGSDDRACPEDVHAKLFHPGFPRKCHKRCSVKHGIASFHRPPENPGVTNITRVHLHGDPLQAPGVRPRPDECPHAEPAVVETDGERGADTPRGPGDEGGVHLAPARNPFQERYELFVEKGGVVEVAQMGGTRDDMEFCAGDFRLHGL